MILAAQTLTDNSADWLMGAGIFAVTGLLVALLFATFAVEYLMEAGKLAGGGGETRITLDG